jgi:hypothetical protein
MRPVMNPYSIRSPTSLGKGGGKPPHSKVGRRFFRFAEWTGVCSVFHCFEFTSGQEGDPSSQKALLWMTAKNG